MPLSMSQATLPALTRGLEALGAILGKAEAHAASKKLDAAALLQARLFSDMYPLVRQVQIACDLAKGTVARLSGAEPPAFADTEASFADLQARIARTLAYVRSIQPEAIDGSETRTITLKARDRTLTFEGQSYLLGFALPNFYFHLTTAYDIFRHNGVELGKLDYIGRI